MSEPLWERIRRLMGELSESLDDAPAPAGDERELADRFRRELRRYEQHRAELSPPDRERLLEFVVDDLLGLARAYAPSAAAPGRADDPARALRLVMDAGAVLSGSLEYEAMLDRLARLAVDWFAEVCAVYVLEGERRVRRVAAVHRDPAGQARLAGIGPGPAGLDHPDHPAAVAIRSGETLHVAEVTPEFLRSVSPGEEARANLEALAPRDVLVIPLTVRGRVTGAIVFMRTAASPPFAAAEVELAEELARRAALAVEDARVREEAERARRARTEFVGSISHEFRTPLMTVVAFAHLLQEGIPVPIPGEARAHVDRILAAAGHLDRLVEALGYQRAEAGWETLRPAPVDLAALVRESAALVEPLARQKGLAFVVDAGDAPFAARTDADKVRQILFSLLGNAVKFTDSGEIRLALRAEEDRAVFEVSDTGIGIEPGDLERVLEPFWQAEPGAVGRGPGIGLGLALLRRHTWMLGGDVRVESEPGRGSTFRVAVPLG